MWDGQWSVGPQHLELTFWKTCKREDSVQYDEKKRESPDHDQGVPANLCFFLSKALVKDRNMELDFQDQQ